MLFDGSMEELLCAVYRIYYDKFPPVLFRKEDYVQNLIDEPEDIRFNEKTFLKVRKSLHEKMDQETLDNIAHALNHRSPDAPSTVLRYIVTCFAAKKNRDDFQRKEILDTVKLARQVGLESHRFLGFVRFSVVQNVYVSRISPDHDILEFIAPHFAERYSTQDFIIYDEKRAKAIIRKDMVLEEGLLREDAFTDYWKAYHEHTSILERKNPKAQKRSMPVRYWTNMVETGSSGEGSPGDGAKGSR
jgi:probable DNA metabolism protein